MAYRARDGRRYPHKETPEEYRARRALSGMKRTMDSGSWALGLVALMVLLVFPWPIALIILLGALTPSGSASEED